MGLVAGQALGQGLVWKSWQGALATALLTVAAGAVVTKDVAPYTIVGGVAASEIKRRFPEGVAARLQALAWWDWDHATLRARLQDFRELPVEAFLEKYE